MSWKRASHPEAPPSARKDAPLTSRQSSRSLRASWMEELHRVSPVPQHIAGMTTSLGRLLELARITRPFLASEFPDTIQLVMQYLVHEGMYDVLHALERDTGTIYSPQLSRMEFRDCRLLTVLVLVLRNTEQLWDHVMTRKPLEDVTLGPSVLVPPLRGATSVATAFMCDASQADPDFWVEIEGTPAPRLVLQKGGAGSHPGRPRKVAAASLNQLVLRLTYEGTIDNHYVNVFFLTYRMFTSTRVLLAKLAQRFRVPSKQASHKDASIIRRRVLGALRVWIGLDDSLGHADLALIQEFCRSEVVAANPKYAQTLSRLLGERNEDGPPNATVIAAAIGGFGSAPSAEPTTKHVPAAAVAPRPHLPKHLFHPKLRLIDIPPLELARQITLCHFSEFAQIRMREFLNQSWNRPKLRHAAANLLGFITRFNHTSKFVATRVLAGGMSWRQRVKAYEHMAETAEHLAALQNQHGLAAFAAALESTSIRRLRIAKWTKPQAVPGDGAQVPFVGTYLTRLTAIDEADPKTVPATDGGAPLINFERCEAAYRVVSEIKCMQAKSYDFLRIPQIERFFLRWSPRLSENEQYAASLAIQPQGGRGVREGEDDDDSEDREGSA